FLTPAFAVVPTSDADCTVTMLVDERHYRELLERGPCPDRPPVGCFAFDGRLVRLPLWAASSEERVIFDAESDVFYFVSPDRSRIRLVTARRHQSRRIPLMRVVREFAMSQSWAAGAVVFHAAAVVVGGHGILISGPKGAGKTSLLIHLLLSQPE